MTDGTRLARYEPEFAPHTNGSRLRSRRGVLRGVTFGFLIGALLATSIVPRLQWLNLGTIGWWGRPVVASAAAGAMAAVVRRGDVRTAMVAGATAALLALWVVYGLVRLSVHVVFIERSITRIVVVDLLRLASFATPAGAAGGALVAAARTLLRRGNSHPAR